MFNMMLSPWVIDDPGVDAGDPMHGTLRMATARVNVGNHTV
jgi:hypothetical protein